MLMNHSSFLFSKTAQYIGVFLLLCSIVLGYAVLYQEFQWKALSIPGWKATLIKGVDTEVNLTDELAMVGMIMGLLLIAFGRGSIEDERRMLLRLKSIQWAVIVHQIGLLVIFLINNLFILQKEILFGSWSIFGDLGWLIYMIFAPLVLFIARFRWLLWIDGRQLMPYKSEGGIHPMVNKGLLLLTLLCLGICLFHMIVVSNEWVDTLFPDYIWQISWYVWPLTLVVYHIGKPKKDQEFEVFSQLISWKYSLIIFYVLITVLTFVINGSSYLFVLLGQVVLLPVLYLIMLPVIQRSSSFLK
jgi:hypothetical protein